jgi:hypothetical protein
MGVFCVNGNEETGKLIKASADGETPFRGMVLTGGVQDTCNEIRDVVTGIYSGELPSGTVTNATTVFVNGEVADEYLESGMTSITLEDFVGKVSGSPSILEGSNEEIIQNAKDLMAKGITGFDILAYRHVVDGEKLAYEFCAAVPAKICIAGSINSFKRIDTMFDIGPWTFTMGSALFEKKFLPEGSFRENLIAVADYMAKK